MPPAATLAEPIAIREPGTTWRRPSWSQRNEDLARIAALLRAGLPVDQAFDDVATVVGDGSTPDEETIPEVIGRFRGTVSSPGHLAVLVDAVEKEKSGGVPETRERLIYRARQIREQSVPSSEHSLGHLRRLASAAEDLLELLLPDDEAEAMPCPS